MGPLGYEPNALTAAPIRFSCYLAQQVRFYWGYWFHRWCGFFFLYTEDKCAYIGSNNDIYIHFVYPCQYLVKKQNLEQQGIDPCASRMQSERSTI